MSKLTFTSAPVPKNREQYVDAFKHLFESIKGRPCTEEEIERVRKRAESVFPNESESK